MNCARCGSDRTEKNDAGYYCFNCRRQFNTKVADTPDPTMVDTETEMHKGRPVQGTSMDGLMIGEETGKNDLARAIAEELIREHGGQTSMEIATTAKELNYFESSIDAFNLIKVAINMLNKKQIILRDYSWNGKGKKIFKKRPCTVTGHLACVHYHNEDPNFNPPPMALFDSGRDSDNDINKFW